MTEIAWLVIATVVGIAAGAAGASFMLARAHRIGRPVDVPDERRLHEAPTPRGGGIGIALAAVVVLPVVFAAALSTEQTRLLVIVLAWALPNALLGFVDDHREISPRLKLCVQTTAASGAVALGLRVCEIGAPPIGTVELGWLGPVFSVAWMVWIANAFNFMDGMDALAAECGAVFFLGLATLALLGGAPGHAALALATAGALLGFLHFNLAPAQIFMGDGGSLCAGALLGGLSLAVASPDVAGVPLAASAVLVGSFAFDATFTVIRRAMRGLALRPHRTHFYQRLVLAGWSQRRVRSLYVSLSVGGLGGAIALARGEPSLQVVCLAAVIGSLLSIAILTRRAERHATQNG